MAKKRFPSNGSGTFSDNLVGFQQTTGNSFTQNNFSTEGTPVQRDTKNFTTSDFSKPISLDDLSTPESIQEVKQMFDQSLKIKFNTEKGSRDLFGSAFLRARVAVENIANNFPGSLYVNKTTSTAQTVTTAYDITYNGQFDTTTLIIPTDAIRNPFGVEYTKKGNTTFDENVDPDRNFATSFKKYVLFYEGTEYEITKAILPKDYSSSILKLTVKGKPFDTQDTYSDFYIKLNDLLTEKKFEQMDDFEQLLLNRESTPLYKSKFRVPKEDGNGEMFIGSEEIVWPMADELNIKVFGLQFESYLDRLFSTCEVIDNYKANLIARFLTTASLQEFDTEDQKVKKVFQLYGRFFDDVKKFIDNIAYMNNVTYDKINNIPDLLLKNLAGLLGMDVVTSINEKNIEEYLYKKKDSQYDGVTKGKTPFETDIEIYRRIILNASYLYKSKGTRKPIRFLMKFIGAPESFIEINEYVYKVINRIDYEKFEERMSEVVDGTWFEDEVTIEWDGSKYQYDLVRVAKEGGVFGPEDYPIERVGDTDNTVPKRPEISNDYFFQKGAGWFERTDDHRSESVLDTDRSDLDSTPKVIKTKFEDFTYGEKYFQRYKTFPNFTDGWELKAEIDNKKSSADNDKFILNRKNIDVFLNPGRAVLYDFVRTYQNHSLTYGGVLLNNFSFAQFADYGFWNGIKVGEGKYGKKYTDLIELFKEYYESGLGKEYDYEKTYAYLDKIGSYWIRLVEQFVPATTLWFTGEKIENHNLHRPKFNWEEPCRNDVVGLDLTLQSSLHDMLLQSIRNYKNMPDCYERLYRYANWYLQININGKTYTVNQNGWNHFFTSSESTTNSSCVNENQGPGSAVNCSDFNNPVFMICGFEEYITCSPDYCEDFIGSIVENLQDISKQIFNEEIKPNLKDVECDGQGGVRYDNTDLVNQNAFEIEGYKGGEDCLDCNGQIKLVANNFQGYCFDFNSIEIGLRMEVNDPSLMCHPCFVLSTIPFSLDPDRCGGIQYDCFASEGTGFDYIDLFLRGGTNRAQDGSVLPYEVIFDCREELDNGEEITYDPVEDKFTIKITTGKNRIIHAYDQSGAPIHILLKERGNETPTGERCVNTISGVAYEEGNYSVTVLPPAPKPCDDNITGSVDEGFDIESMTPQSEPCDDNITCTVYGRSDLNVTLASSTGGRSDGRSYDCGSTYTGERYGYGSYGEYNSYGYGSDNEAGSCEGTIEGSVDEGFEINALTPRSQGRGSVCTGTLVYEILPECQGYEVDTELYRVIGSNTIQSVEDIQVGVTVEPVMVQDINEGDFIVVSYPELGEISYPDYSAFYYGDETVVCNYTDNVAAVEITDVMCGRIYKYVNINNGDIKLEYHQNVLVLEDMFKTNSNDIIINCYEEAPTMPLDKVVNLNGPAGQMFYDNEYGMVSKAAHKVTEGDYIVTTDGCGVILVESVSYDDYCDDGLFVNKHMLKYQVNTYAWYKPKDGMDTIYVNDNCVSYCICDINENPNCTDIITHQTNVCLTDVAFEINYFCADDLQTQFVIG